MSIDMLIGGGAALLMVFLFWMFYATGVEVERKRQKKVDQ